MVRAVLTNFLAAVKHRVKSADVTVLVVLYHVCILLEFIPYYEGETF